MTDRQNAMVLKFVTGKRHINLPIFLLDFRNPDNDRTYSLV